MENEGDPHGTLCEYVFLKGACGCVCVCACSCHHFQCPRLRGQWQVSDPSNPGISTGRWGGGGAGVRKSDVCRMEGEEECWKGWMIEQREKRGVKHQGEELSQFRERQHDG